MITATGFRSTRRTANSCLTLQTLDLHARTTNFAGIWGDFGGTRAGASPRVAGPVHAYFETCLPTALVRADPNSTKVTGFPRVPTRAIHEIRTFNTAIAL